jgi:hypothetical protein
MNILQVLHREENKLVQAFGKIEGELRGVRAAINALSSNGNGIKYATRVSKLRGKKLSAAHRHAIELGIAKAKKAAAAKA